MLIKANMYAAGGEAATYVEDPIAVNTDITYNVTTGVFWLIGETYANATTIAIKDGELIKEYDSSYATVDYTDGVLTVHNNGYNAQVIYGYYI